MYRSSKWVTLNATAYNNEHAKFLDSNGLMLPDMDPILTGLSWTENSSYQASDDFGGTGGTAFNDINPIPASTGVSTLTLRSGNRVDNIGLPLSNGTTFAHGDQISRQGGAAKGLYAISSGRSAEGLG